MEITVEVVEATDSHPEYTLCRPVGDIDAYSVGEFREALTEVGDVDRLLIDLSQVGFMDSAGLGSLIGGIRRVKGDNEGSVVVFCDGPSLIRLLHTTGFDRIVPVVESMDDAHAALAESVG